MKRLITLFFLLTVSMVVNATETDESNYIRGTVKNEAGEPLVGAVVVFTGTGKSTHTDREGTFRIALRGQSTIEIKASYVGYITETKKTDSKIIHFVLKANNIQIDVIEVFGSSRKQPEKMDFLTRMPLRPSEQIQSISVISEKMIAQQGNLTLSDAAKNVVGISTFATYGGTSESISARGFRGLPVLKNGIRVHSDFRGIGVMSDMQGVESVQIVKGSAAVTQGIGNDTGSAGGTINIATKTPKFTNEAEVALRAGSWGLVRTTFDLQRVVSKEKNVAMRFNGAFERGDSYRVYVSKDRTYLNPSLEWRMSPKTSLIVEMDYLHDSRTPDRGTVNLGVDSVNMLYDMPHDKFLGFKSDRIFTDQTTYSARFNHRFSENISLRLAYVGSMLDTDNTGASTAKMNANKDFNSLKRSIGRSLRSDKNQAVQIDLIGTDVFTGRIKHTFQVGIDYKSSKVTTTAYKSLVIDTIDVLENFTNELPSDITLTAQNPTGSSSYSYGVMAQDVITFNKYAKAVLGARYSFGNSSDISSAGSTSGDAFNPMLGVIVTPFDDFHIFGSYTNTTDLRSAANRKEDGSLIGASSIVQFETGIKSEWLDRKLRFNLTLFQVINSNLAYSVFDESGQATGFYDLAGDLQRKGVEAELTGRPLRNLQVVLGYAFLDAQYKNSPAYMDGSAPMNAPKHTANSWIYYSFDKSFLKGLSLGVGVYYVGERPVTDHTKKTVHTNTYPGMKPFDMPAYTTLNATVAYTYKKASLSLLINNILNEIGYSSYYRGGYINPIDPFNASVTLSYRF